MPSFKQASKRSAVPELVVKGCALLDGLVTRNERAAECSKGACLRKRSVFDVPVGVVAQIGAGKYVRRLFRGARCPEEVFVAQLVLLHRFERVAGVLTTASNVHRLLLISLIVASKVCADLVYTNSSYHKIGDVCLAEINMMERTFLTALDWDVAVSREEYNTMRATIESLEVSRSGSESAGSAELSSPIRVSDLNSQGDADSVASGSPTKAVRALREELRRLSNSSSVSSASN
ncbi:Cyclin-U4-1 [Diplonema papillatum]|nr:Cyclin-U4-1 [Diplonema papillatum]